LAHLRAFIRARLLHEGHALVVKAEAMPAAAGAAMKGLCEALRDKREQASAMAIAKAPAISQQQAEELERRQFLLPEQQAALQRRELCQRLALDPDQLTPAMVQWGQKWAGAAKRLAMLLAPAGTPMALAADAKRATATAAGGALLPFDQSFNQQMVLAAEVSGLKAFVLQALDLNEWSNDSPEAMALADSAKHHAAAFRQCFGISINQQETPAAVVGKLLRHFGLITTSSRCFNASRRYSLELDQMGMILEAAKRLQRKASEHSTWPGSVYIASPSGMDSSNLPPQPNGLGTARQQALAHQAVAMEYLPNSFNGAKPPNPIGEGAFGSQPQGGAQLRAS